MIDWTGARELAHSTGLDHRGGALVIDIAEAVGETLAQDAVSLAPLPGYSSSAMDGWVVAGAGPWKLGCAIRIGESPSIEALQPGNARAITTGGAIPVGATAVVRSEIGQVDGGVLAASKAPGRGDHIRLAGEEAGTGDLLVAAGSILTPPRVALAAVGGNDSLTVTAAPRVSLLLLGSEVEAQGIPAPGRVRDAYSPQLPALLLSLGARLVDRRRIADELDLTVSGMTAGEVELVITTGGTARGSADHVRDALTTLGATLLIDGVHMRPGHPAILARLPGGRLILCLPGNPFAAMVVLASLGVPLVDGLLGRPLDRLGSTVFALPVENSGRHTHLVAYRLSPDGAVPTGHQGSGMLRGLAKADGLAVIPPGGSSAGVPVAAVSLPW